MSPRESSSSNSVMLAFAIGAIAGAAIALLYAPASGEETRKRLKKKARAGREFLKAQAEAAGDRVSEAVERGKRAFDDFKDAHDADGERL